MKKILNTLLITVGFSSVAFGAAGIYTPAPGPLTLGDTYVPNPQNPTLPTIQRGRIMQTIMSDQELTKELITYTNTWYTQFPLYQTIVESLKTSTNNRESIAAIEVFEKAVMKILHYEHYIYYTEGSWSNMFVTGIRKTWFSPSDWINISTWLPSYTSADIAQLMTELKQLSAIAFRHSVTLAARLSNKADSYLYWKRRLNMLAALGAAAGAYYYRDDIKNTLAEEGPKIANASYNALANAGAYVRDAAYSAGPKVANASYNALANTGTYTKDTAYNAGAYLGNRALEVRDAAYQATASGLQSLRDRIFSN